MFTSFLDFAISIILLPVCFGTLRSFFETLYTLGRSSGDLKPQIISFLSGSVIYIMAHILLFKPMRIYVFGHELTHAVAGILSGARVRSFKVKRNVGSVSMSKVNIFSTLAPYFIPIYSVIFILVYAILSWYLKNRGYNIHLYFIFILGFTIAFHLALTVFAIRQGQSDLRQYGTVLSLIIITVANCVVMIFILSLFFPVSFKFFMLKIFLHTKTVFIFIYKYGNLVVDKVVSAISQN